MKKYNRRAVEVQAVQWTGKNLDELIEFLGDALGPIERRIDYKPRVYGHNMNVSDYVMAICDTPKAFIVLNAEDFEALYEPAE